MNTGRLFFLILAWIFFPLPAVADQAELPVIVSGKTLMVVQGHPGALRGKPEPGWQTPEAEVVPRVPLYWIRIDNENGHRLFYTVSDDNGTYRISLPTGKYRVENPERHKWQIQQLKNNKRDTEKALILVLLFDMELKQNGDLFFKGTPDYDFIEGRSYSADIEARILYVD